MPNVYKIQIAPSGFINPDGKNVPRYAVRPDQLIEFCLVDGAVKAQVKLTSNGERPVEPFGINPLNLCAPDPSPLRLQNDTIGQSFTLLLTGIETRDGVQRPLPTEGMTGELDVDPGVER